MTGVLSGLFIVWSIIAVGYLVGRTGALGPQARLTLSRTTFFVGTPALVLVSLLDSDPRSVLSAPLLVAALAGLLTGGSTLLLVRLLTARRGADLVVAAISSSVANGANMGFPIAAYVLGDVSHALPVILFQQALYTPLYLLVLDQVSRVRRTSAPQERLPDAPGGPARRDRRGAGQAALSLGRSVAVNPTVIAAALGLALTLADVRVPHLLLEPVRALADLAIPAMLLSFGISLIGAALLSRAAGYRGLTLAVSAVKLLVMPLLALGIGLLLGLSGHALYAVVVMAALPTAQNVYVAASRYGAAEELARDAVLVTTVGVVVTLLAASALFSA